MKTVTVTTAPEQVEFPEIGDKIAICLEFLPEGSDRIVTTISHYVTEEYYGDMESNIHSNLNHIGDNFEDVTGVMAIAKVDFGDDHGVRNVHYDVDFDHMVYNEEIEMWEVGSSNTITFFKVDEQDVLK